MERPAYVVRLNGELPLVILAPIESRRFDWTPAAREALLWLSARGANGRQK